MLTISNGIIQDTEILGVPVKIDIVPYVTGKHRPKTWSRKSSTTYHDTGNKREGSDAEMHAKYLKNLEKNPIDSQVSWHFVVDDKEIIQCIPVDEVAYCQGHAEGNRTSISVEQCIQASYDVDKAEDNACKLHAALAVTMGLTLKKHQDWTGKPCPGQILNRQGWQDIVDKINKYKIELSEGTPIMANPTVTIAQMRAWALSKKANPLFIELADVYYNISVKTGIDPAVTYAQSAKETAYMKFGGVLDASFKNPCGLKTSQGGDNKDPNAHKRFASWEEGIQAQVDHLALYAGKEGYPKAGSPDPRHFPYLRGTAPTVESLGGKWAPASNYGTSIVAMMKQIQSMDIKGDVKPTAPKVEQVKVKDAVITYDAGSEKFALELSKLISVPIISSGTMHDYSNYKIVIGVGDQSYIRSHTAYLTHFVNAQDNWSTDRNNKFLKAARNNLDAFKRRRDD